MSRPDRPVDKFGFPIPVTFHEPPAPRKGFRLPESPHSRRVIGILAGVVVIGILVAPWFVRKTRGIMAEMYRNRAHDQMIEGDLPGALENLDRAVAWRPGDMKLLHERAQVRLANHDLDGALADANTVLADSKKFTLGYLLRGTIHRRRGENLEAIQDATEAVKNSQDRDPMPLNARAYFRALANKDLNEALVDIQNALKLKGDDPAYLDTRGYVFYKLDKPAEALADFDQAIVSCEQTKKEKDERRKAFESLGNQRFELEEFQKLEFDLKALDENLAVMYHHRGETHEKLGNAQESKDDLEMAQKLGYDPDKGIE